MNQHTEENISFLHAETRKINKVRNVFIGLFISVFLFCYGFFFYVFLKKWLSSTDRMDFFHKSIPLLTTLFIYFGMIFGTLSWLIHQRYRCFTDALHTLRSSDIITYQQYTARLIRAFTNTAPYLFRGNELLIFKFITSKSIHIPALCHIETKVVYHYRAPNSFRVHFYTQSGKIGHVTLNQKGAFDFLLLQLRRENPQLSIFMQDR